MLKISITKLQFLADKLHIKMLDGLGGRENLLYININVI